MDKDKVKGKAQQAKGAAKESWGKVTGDTSSEVKGKAEKGGGKAREAVGKGKERMKDRGH